jgi:hypothetical protein
MNSRDGNVPSTDEALMEKRLVEEGLTAPRVTPEHVDSQIVSEHYFTAYNGRMGALTAGEFVAIERPSANEQDLLPLRLLTFCVLVLANGFTVVGESACASPENFKPQVGRDIARRNARDKIWALEGYLLRTTLMARARFYTDEGTPS